MEGVDRGGGFVIAAHGDETEATGAATHAVEHDGGLEDGAVGAEGVLKVLFRNIEGEVSDEEFIVHLMICCFYPKLLSADCSRPSGFKPSLNRVHLKIYHALIAMS